MGWLCEVLQVDHQALYRTIQYWGFSGWKGSCYLPKVLMLCIQSPGSFISSYVLLSTKCSPIIAGERESTMEVERLVIHPQ